MGRLPDRQTDRQTNMGYYFRTHIVNPESKSRGVKSNKIIYIPLTHVCLLWHCLKVTPSIRPCAQQKVVK